MNEESILESLFWLNNENHPINSDKIKKGFDELRHTIGWLHSHEFDRVYNIVCDLCVLHSEAAFAEGVRIGVLLMKEIGRKSIPQNNSSNHRVSTIMSTMLIKLLLLV